VDGRTWGIVIVIAIIVVLAIVEIVFEIVIQAFGRRGSTSGNCRDGIPTFRGGAILCFFILWSLPLVYVVYRTFAGVFANAVDLHLLLLVFCVSSVSLAVSIALPRWRGLQRLAVANSSRLTEASRKLLIFSLIWVSVALVGLGWWGLYHAMAPW